MYGGHKIIKKKQAKPHSCRQNPNCQQQQVPPAGSPPIVAQNFNNVLQKGVNKEWLRKLNSSASIVQPGESKSWMIGSLDSMI